MYINVRGKPWTSLSLPILFHLVVLWSFYYCTSDSHGKSWFPYSLQDLYRTVQGVERLDEQERREWHEGVDTSGYSHLLHHVFLVSELYNLGYVTFSSKDTFYITYTNIYNRYINNMVDRTTAGQFQSSDFTEIWVLLKSSELSDETLLRFDNRLRCTLNYISVFHETEEIRFDRMICVGVYFREICLID